MAPGAGGRLRGASSVQVRRLRTVFGSGRACRNSCDFRQPLRPARCEPSGLPAHDSRRSPPGTPSSPLPPGPGCRSCRIAAIVAAPPPHPPYITLSPQTPPFSHIIPYAPPPPVSARTPYPPAPHLRPHHRGRPCRLRVDAPTERNLRSHGKPFLAASNALADYSESPTSRTSRERIEGVSRSLPFSDLLALTSSHVFLSVVN